MDYYLDTGVTYAGTRCTSATDPAAGVTSEVRVTLANAAPADAVESLPEAVTGPGTYGVPKGSVQTNLVVLGEPGGSITSVQRDGWPAGFAAATLRGRPATVISVRLEPGERASVLVGFSAADPAAPIEIWSTPTRDRPGSAGLTLRAAPRDC
jgi:hypothetical protein